MTNKIQKLKIKRKAMQHENPSFCLIDFVAKDQKYPYLDPDLVGQNRGKNRVKQNLEFQIEMFGVNEKRESCCIHVRNFNPFFYVMVSEKWTCTDAFDFMECFLKPQLKTPQYLVNANLVEFAPLYGFAAGKKSRFVELSFANMRAFHETKNLWFKQSEATQDTKTRARKKIDMFYKETKLELYETFLSPLLRFFHIQRVSPSGWVEIPTANTEIPDFPVSTCTYEWFIDYCNIIPQPHKHTVVPYTICSFDIEATSSHGDFPLPVKTYRKLADQAVSCFISQMKNGPMNNARARILFKEIMLSAFQMKTRPFDGIDYVYTKDTGVKITATMVKSWIDTLLEYPLFTIKQNNKTLDKEQEFLFKRVNMTAIEEGDDPAADAEEMPEQGVEQSASDKTYLKIVDVLLDGSAKYSREAKVNILNKLLSGSGILPEVRGDEVSFIGSTFLNYGEKEPYLNHCLVVGSCAQVSGVEIVECNTEKELLLKWTQLIQEKNPDIIIGYNIFMFDYEFMFERALENECADVFLMLSRERNTVCSSNKWLPDGESESTVVEKGLEGILINDEPENGGENTIELKNAKLCVASGEYYLHYPEIVGRLQVDMFMYYRRDYQLSSYKLDDVAGIYIGDSVEMVCQLHATATVNGCGIATKNIKGIHVNDFIHVQREEFTTDNLEGGRKFRVLAILEAEDVSLATVVSGGNKVLVIDAQLSEQSFKEWCDYADKGVLRWGMAKDDVSPQDIFRLTNGSAEDRAVVAKYCIQDCNLVHTLFLKMDVLTTYVEMAKICNVPISYLVFRGQGIKLTSYIAQKCRDMGTLMPDLEKATGEEGGAGADDSYEGAIVLPPKCGMYFDNPVACNDFASLYPSIAEAYNLCPQSLVFTVQRDLEGNQIGQIQSECPPIFRTAKKSFYDDEPGYKYIDVPFDTYSYVRKTPKSAAVKVKTGTKTCRWALFPDNRKSIVPNIIHELLTARNDTKAQIKTETDPFMKNVLDKRQLGLKVTANSLYGQFGSKTCSFGKKDLAASITAIGRRMITYVKRVVEEIYSDRVVEVPAVYSQKGGAVEKVELKRTRAEYVYGDSVAWYTPIYVRDSQMKMNDEYKALKICQISLLFGCGGWVNCVEPGKEDKEFCEMRADIETWTNEGWTRLFRVIRHRLAPEKRMVRVLTLTGLVDVTDDHSLLTADGHKISPKSCTAGETKLLHHELEQLNRSYLLDGAQLREKFYKLLKERPKYRVFNTMIEAARFIMDLRTLNTPVCYTLDYDHDRFCVLMEWFTTIELLSDVSYKRHLDFIHENTVQRLEDITESYYDSFNKLNENKNSSPYVYDLTTNNNHFAAGVGNMIVHNTDSVFFTFNLENPLTGEKIRGKRALEITITLAQEAARLCTLFLPPPMKLAYEKTLMNFVLISKKRYVGMLYETDPTDGYLKYMGLALKRRDVCDYLKDVYGGLIMIFKEGASDTIQRAIEHLNQALKTLVDGGVSMDKLVFSKALRSYYKKPEQIPHAVLAERITLRDPGNRPKPGDRMQFAVVEISAKEQKQILDAKNKRLTILGEKPKKSLLMGDRVETPAYIVAKNLKLDYAYYVENQLLNPIRQLFGLILEPIMEYKGRGVEIPAVRRELETIRKNSTDLEDYMVKREKYCSAKVEQLLFGDVLKIIENRKNGLKPITDFFVFEPKAKYIV